MAIYDFSKSIKGELKTSSFDNERVKEKEPSIVSEVVENSQEVASRRDRLFSAIAARLFFALLLLGDVLWICYAMGLLIVSLVGFSVTGGKIGRFKQLGEKAWMSLRRSLVCGVSLLIALFSPAFGIMIACTYFLMYDKTGIEEVVPSSLQSQFKEFLPRGQE